MRQKMLTFSEHWQCALNMDSLFLPAQPYKVKLRFPETRGGLFKFTQPARGRCRIRTSTMLPTSTAHVKTPSLCLAQSWCSIWILFHFPLFTAFCLITQLFLQMSEAVKATKCCTIQFIAFRQSGICPKVIHSATFLTGTECKSRDCLFHCSISSGLSIHTSQWSGWGLW